MPEEHSAPVELADEQTALISGGDKSAPEVKQTMNIGSQTSGAVAGNVCCNPF